MSVIQKGSSWLDLYAVYRMDVLHAIQNYPANLLQRLVWPHDTDGAALHQYITLRQELNSL